jgi:hypothetical protein
MAFTLPLIINGEAQAAAYVKATIARCNTQTTVVQLEVWTSQSSRTNGGQFIPDNWLPSGFNSLEVFTTDLNLQSENPVDYAYQLLEASGKYTEATWNV